MLLVSAGALPLRSPLPEIFPQTAGRMDGRTHREPCVHFTITAFHLLSTSPACACCLWLLSLFSPVHTNSCPSVSLSAGTKTPEALPQGFKPPSRAQPCVQLTRVALLWLLGHCLAAGIVSHSTAPVPSGLPGPPSP